MSKNSFKSQQELRVGNKTYTYYSLPEASKTLGDISRLPFSLKILLENLLRSEDGVAVEEGDIRALCRWLETKKSSHEIAFSPSRVLMQDFTGVPAVVDLAAMRGAIKRMGGNPDVINPLTPVDLVIDHSVMVDAYGTPESFQENVDMEFGRNRERYEFLRWGQHAFNNFRVVPPGTGICHQVNLESLAQVVWTKSENGHTLAYPDTLVGTDSHTTMVNGLAVLGWGVGGIEAEAAMLGQPISMLIPEVVGFKMYGELPEGVTATDLVLTVTQMLRAHNVVGKFVEFFGDGLDQLTLADRATLANMAPEYGATCGIFPIDQETLNYLRFTGRDEERIALVEAYAKAQGLWREKGTLDAHYTDLLTLNLADVEPSLAGPKRPQDRVRLRDAALTTKTLLTKELGEAADKRFPADGFDMGHGDVVIAAITSCTNTSNPMVMLGAGLLAQKARARGLSTKPWVKTSLAPGSQVVTDYLKAADLQKDLDALGFELVGYGCTTCIGNSGPLDEVIAKTIDDNGLTVAAVLSGNRNFEGRIHPQVKLNFLASPPLVVAYALAGTLQIDLTKDPLGQDQKGNPVYLKDIWPTTAEIKECLRKNLTSDMFRKRYKDVFKGDALWQDISIEAGMTYDWNTRSTYVKEPPFFETSGLVGSTLSDIIDARPLAILGDSVTTDHISPAGSIKKESPAGIYLLSHNVEPRDFNSYGSRRGNHEVMMRGTFANIRLQNEMTPDIQGGYTRFMPSGERLAIYDAAMRYEQEGVPFVIIAGQEYGTGSSRDWAAKGTRLLGVRAVIAESFERIHRSNLIGMGVLPLVFTEGTTRQSLDLDGSEIFTLRGIENSLKPRSLLECTLTRQDGRQETLTLHSRIDTENEAEYFKNGGILHYVLKNLVKTQKAA